MNEHEVLAKILFKNELLRDSVNYCEVFHLFPKHFRFFPPKKKMIATETAEDTEGKYSVLSVYSVAKIILYIQKNPPP